MHKVNAYALSHILSGSKHEYSCKYLGVSTIMHGYSLDIWWTCIRVAGDTIGGLKLTLLGRCIRVAGDTNNKLNTKQNKNKSNY